MTSSKSDIVVLENYTPAWQWWYEKESAELTTLLGPCVRATEHYGSTAVHGMLAKPIIGILVGLADCQLSAQNQHVLKDHGYAPLPASNETYDHYWEKIRPPISHVAFVIYQSQLWYDHLVIRDYLRCHPDEQKFYAAVKQEALAQGYNTYQKYQNYKKPFLLTLFERAKTWRCTQLCQCDIIENVGNEHSA